MPDPKTAKGLWQRMRERLSSPQEPLKIAPDLPMRRSAQAPTGKPAAAPRKFPGNFFTFSFLLDLQIGDQVHVGRPKTAIFEIVSQTTRWGESVEAAQRLLTADHVRWTDDPVTGVNLRTIHNVEDVLGAEGKLGDRPCRFETILDLGRNIIVYGLYCPADGTRTAFGFLREVFDASYVKPPRPEDPERG